MVPWLFRAVGLVLGTALGAGILHARSSSRLAVSEAAAGELRKQLEQIGAESSDLKAKLEEEQRARVQAETLLQSECEKLQEEKNQFDESRARLSETFQGLAGEALKSNNQAFLELATQTLETLRAQGVGDLDQRKEAIQALVTPLSESLKTYAQCVHDMERRREAAYGDLNDHGSGHPGKPSARDVQPRDGAAPNLGARPLGRADVTASGGTGRHGRALRLRGATRGGRARETSASGYDHPNARRPHCTRGLQGAPRRLSRRPPSDLGRAAERALMQAMCAGMWPNWRR